jgi:hypothetical protein
MVVVMACAKNVEKGARLTMFLNAKKCRPPLTMEKSKTSEA